MTLSGFKEQTCSEALQKKKSSCLQANLPSPRQMAFTQFLDGVGGKRKERSVSWRSFFSLAGETLPPLKDILVTSNKCPFCFPEENIW